MVGVFVLVGLICIYEVVVKLEYYLYVLVMMMIYNGLSVKFIYVFLVILVDVNVVKVNSGLFLEGVLMMLLFFFDIFKIINEEVCCIVEMFKCYGVYVIDVNDGMFFVIFVEIGLSVNFLLVGWNVIVFNEL